LGEKWNVLVYELFLECDSKGADKDLSLSSAKVVDGRYQIGETLADAGSCFDREASSVDEGLLHCSGHFKLLRSGFKTGKAACDSPVRSENAVHLQ